MASWKNLVFVFEIGKLSIWTFQFYVYKLLSHNTARQMNDCIFFKRCRPFQVCVSYQPVPILLPKRLKIPSNLVWSAASSGVSAEVNWCLCRSVNSLHERCHGQKNSLDPKQINPMISEFQAIYCLFFYITNIIGDLFYFMYVNWWSLCNGSSSIFMDSLREKARNIFLPSNAVNRG